VCCSTRCRQKNVLASCVGILRSFEAVVLVLLVSEYRVLELLTVGDIFFATRRQPDNDAQRGVGLPRVSPKARESDQGFLQGPAVASNPPPRPLGSSSPNPMLDVVIQGVLQACFADGAICADALGDLYAHPFAWKEGLRGKVTALALRHPGIVLHIGSF
jgi:hypothetical protein